MWGFGLAENETLLKMFKLLSLSILHFSKMNLEIVKKLNGREVNQTEGRYLGLSLDQISFLPTVTMKLHVHKSHSVTDSQNWKGPIEIMRSTHHWHLRYY